MEVEAHRRVFCCPLEGSHAREDMQTASINVACADRPRLELEVVRSELLALILQELLEQPELHL